MMRPIEISDALWLEDAPISDVIICGLAMLLSMSNYIHNKAVDEEIGYFVLSDVGKTT